MLLPFLPESREPERLSPTVGEADTQRLRPGTLRQVLGLGSLCQTDRWTLPDLGQKHGLGGVQRRPLGL